MTVEATPFSEERANDIIRQARCRTRCGPWEENLIRCMNQGEYHHVMNVWEKLPGTASFMTAIYTIAHG